ncbi:MAG: helix-turn-helix transcriptional regulator [Christensenellales bacterium]|nr:helix-turn-helix transcriptional regulator [Christensenellales bacterium]
MRTNLINERKKKKLTQTEIAKILGITDRQYARLEAGTSNGSIKVWQSLKDLFQKSIDYLLEQAVDLHPK